MLLALDVYIVPGVKFNNILIIIFHIVKFRTIYASVIKLYIWEDICNVEKF